MSNILALLPAFGAKQQKAGKEMKGTMKDMSESVLHKKNKDESNRTHRYGRPNADGNGKQQRRAMGRSPIGRTLSGNKSKSPKAPMRRSQTLPETNACPEGIKSRRKPIKKTLSSTKE